MTGSSVGTVKIVPAGELRAAITPADLVEPMREAFTALSDGRFRTTFSLLDLDDGDVHIKASSELGGPLYVVKLASWVESNARRGRPGGSGAIVVCSAETGAPLTLLVDEHYLTDARTAAAGALATDLLAPAGSSSVAVLGAGVQARLQVRTLATLRKVEQVVVWARRADAAAALVTDLEAGLDGARVTAAATARQAVESADIVITATASRAPLVEAEWLRAGQHITALGADDDRKRELTTACFSRADLVVVDSRAQSGRTAELREALAAGAVRERHIAELGEVLAGRATGRQSGDEITIAKLTGVAAQDLAAARAVLDRLGSAA